MLEWNIIDSQDSFEEVVSQSYSSDILIFKHSTSCSISHIAKMRLEENWKIETISPFYLDLKRFRDISDSISETLKVPHESPQVILVRKGQCIYDASHFDITIEELEETLLWHQAQNDASDI